MPSDLGADKNDLGLILHLDKFNLAFNFFISGRSFDLITQQRIICAAKSHQGKVNTSSDYFIDGCQFSGQPKGLPDNGLSFRMVQQHLNGLHAV